MSNLMSTALLLPLTYALLGAHHAQCAPPPRSSQTERILEQELERAATIVWTDSPLRQAMQGVMTSRGVPVWVDRRCDPSQPINLTSHASLADAFWELSQSNPQLDIAWSSDVIYVGPEHEANRWATMHQWHRQQIGRLPRPARRRWLATSPWQWTRLTDPQTLLQQLETELGIRIEDRKRVTHDLWPAADFPPLPAFVRLELLTAGFGDTFELQSDGRAILRPMPTAPALVRTVDVSANSQAAVQAIVDADPLAQWSADRKQLKASWRTHEAIARERRSSAGNSTSDREPRPAQPSLDNLRFTLRANDQLLGPFLAQLGKQLNLKIELSQAAQEKSNHRISFAVEQATVDELFTAILRPEELIHERDDTIVHVKAP